MNGVHQYFHSKVQAARDLVYRVGHAVAGAHVDGLLKETSSVPTVVSKVPFIIHDLTRHGTELFLRTTQTAKKGIRYLTDDGR